MKFMEDTSELIQKIKDRLRSKQKSYVDRWRRDPEFEVGDDFFLKVSL